MWLRNKRPAMEAIGGAMWATATGAVRTVTDPLAAVADTHLPGIGYKIIALFGAVYGYNYFWSSEFDNTEAYAFLDKMHTFSLAQGLAEEGFWLSESDDAEKRRQKYNLDCLRLEQEWDSALETATQTRSFDALVAGLAVDPNSIPAEVPKPVSWRFNMMPYGDGHAQTFPFQSHDANGGGGGSNLMELGSYGDYINRTDNKPNPIRKARHLYTSVYIPPTK
mmetsp:Transcript_62600/g.167680  ORF Transcript_62600/g.167680 Transcript_62600/m.167680 type:complete len:222 (+) Transcript_62600:172-837(+)